MDGSRLPGPLRLDDGHNPLHPRLIGPRFAEALRIPPSSWSRGPASVATFVQMVCAPEFPRNAGLADPDIRNYRYISFDDDVVRAAADSDPMGFISDFPGRVVLDEVQRVPTLFTALKLAVDRQPVPGRFVLTGSTNVLAVPNVQDSLAGRLETIRLHPLAQRELHPDHLQVTDSSTPIRQQIPLPSHRKAGRRVGRANCVWRLPSRPRPCPGSQRLATS